MSHTPSNPASCILLTGVTGFLGKIVLEELFRRRREFTFRKIILLTRPKRGHDVQTRFYEDVAKAACFSLLPAGWTDSVQVVTGDLRQKKCGIKEEIYDSICNEITHIIHCAGSIKFDLPLAEASVANINSTLSVLELAQMSPNLQHMVSTSTAYASPHTAGPIGEVLAPLPRAAAVLFSDIQNGVVTEAELLHATGHPNTYTLTKCIAEHLLMDRRGLIPLTIVRPSIISASWLYPFPGWIDSQAALAGFVALTGTGILHVIDGNPKVLLDIIPVDEVARRLIDATFALAKDDGVAILHSAAGPQNRVELHTISSTVTAFFRDNRIGRRPKIHHLGTRDARYRFYEITRQILPVKLTKTYHKLRGDAKKQRRAESGGNALAAINNTFPYFTHHTFDFRPSESIPADFNMEMYLHTVCRGVQRHLLNQPTTALPIGGWTHKPPSSDLRWALTQPATNATTRLTALLLRKTLRRTFSTVTVDVMSFDRAIRSVSLSASSAHTGAGGGVGPRARTGAGAEPAPAPAPAPAPPKPPTILLLPTHRSYLDPLLLPYLLFTHPTLHIPTPHIAAAAEFADLPGLGWWFRNSHAFFVGRGQGGPDPALDAQIQDLVEADASILFFIEGARSRSRQVLPPRRGMLRALQGTGERFVVLPVSISYERVAEERSFARELRGALKPRMSVAGLLRWTGRMLAGRVRLGRVHVRCGEVLRFDAATDVWGFGRAVARELLVGTVVSVWQLECFARRHRGAGLEGAWLRGVVEQRGGVVVESWKEAREGGLDPELGPELGLERDAQLDLDPAIELTFQHHWQHFFFAEARALAPHNLALAHYVAENDYTGAELGVGPATDDERITMLLSCLFKPVCADYAGLAQVAGEYVGEPGVAARLLLGGCANLMTARAALRCLVERGYLVPCKSGKGSEEERYRVVASLAELEGFADACAWPVGLDREDEKGECG